MILDKELEMATTVPLDLGVNRPGPGNPIIMFASGMTPAAVILVESSATSGGTYASAGEAVVGADGSVEFRLSSTTARWIKSTFAGGALNITLEGNQTNV